MQASKLNETHMPKQLLRKTSLTHKPTPLTSTPYQLTTGNAAIEFQPPEIKFTGYQLNQQHVATVKIINKSPIAQRVHILPPTEPGFSIRVNKKGPIAAGMSENVQVVFCSDAWKYQYDVVRVNTETGNFVIPIYAYPTIPGIEGLFPRVIDFGAVAVNDSNAYMYPVRNPVPLDFTYEFKYVEESPAFMITPIRGTIPADSTENIEITFLPSDRRTFTAEVEFVIGQFDFNPIRIKLIGSGKEKGLLGSTKRIKSSKLNPIRASENSKIQAPQPQIAYEIPPNEARTLDINTGTLKKSFIRSKASFPKLLKKTLGPTPNTNNFSMMDKLQTSIKKQGERDYMGQYSRIQELAKQKQIKFMQYLGDRLLTEQQLQFQLQLMEETKRGRLENLKEICINRFNSDRNQNCEVDLSKVEQRAVTWDIKRNNELKIRRQKLEMFVKAGTNVIKKYRLLKRLGKIKEFLQDCNTRQQVSKKVDEDFAKSLDQGNSKTTKKRQKLDFSLQMLAGRSFPLQFKDQTAEAGKTFTPEGSDKFDDYFTLDQLQPNQCQLVAYGHVPFPQDFFYPAKTIPKARQSAEEEYPLRGPSLPPHSITPASSVYGLPLKVPTHQFIHNDYEFTQFRTTEPEDEKSPAYLLDASAANIEDQFQGWSKGEMEVLRAKFQRNMGCQFEGISRYNYPETCPDIGFMGELASHLPRQIARNQVTPDDVIDQGDSDEQAPNPIEVDKADVLITKVEEKSVRAKERRQKGAMHNYEAELMGVMEGNLKVVRMGALARGVDKLAELNKWANRKENRINV